MGDLKSNMAATEHFPTFSLENHLSLRPYQFLNLVHKIGSAKRLSERELITAALDHCVGHAKTLIDNEPTFSDQTSWIDFSHQFTTFCNKYLTFDELLKVFESMNQKSGENVETFSKRLESMANMLAEMAQYTLHPEVSTRAIANKDLVRLFAEGLIVGEDDVLTKNPKNLRDAVKIAEAIQMQRHNKLSAYSNIGSAANELYITQHDLSNMERVLNSSVTTAEMVKGFLNQIQGHLRILADLHGYISDERLKNLHTDVINKAKNLKKLLNSYSMK